MKWKDLTLTPTGYRVVVIPPARHRAVMTGERSLLNFETKAYLCDQPEHGAHYVATFTPAALLAEYRARAIEAARDVTR